MSLFLKCLNMKRNGFSNELKHFRLRFTHCNATTQIRNICPDAGGTVLNNNHVTHMRPNPLAQRA